VSGSALLVVGATAPDFSAAGSDGLTYTLRELLGRVDVVLLFYPGNNTPG
jgi:peroxiredoxin